MARKVYRMDDLDLPNIDGDGESTVDPYSKHGHFIQPDFKSTVDMSDYIGPDPADSPSGVVADSTSASGVIDPEFQSEDKPKTRRTRSAAKPKADDADKGDDPK